MPTVVLVWVVALAGGAIEAAWSLALAGVMALAGGALLMPRRRHPKSSQERGRTISATLALACVLGAVVAVHCAATAGKREQGPLAQAAETGGGVVIHLLVTGSPVEVPARGHSGDSRWTVPAGLVEFTSEGTVVRGSADVVVVGGDGWQHVRPGQRIRTTGALKEVRVGQSHAALLSAASPPVITGEGYDVRQTATHLRKQFLSAAAWLPPDAAGLLPGMVTGDTSALPESLETDMKTTGMTHLTAVSGANCSLILGGFILLARCLRLPRPAAAVFAACGLSAFVLMVGPDPSVLRAAVMGAVGLTALAGGLRGRSLTFLCLAAVMLLLLEPSMASNVGFLLSVLATLGIVLLAARIASWIPARIPRWLAAGMAVPLSAQLLCGPVIVALQPQLTPYALAANVVAGPLVAPVTVLGTIAVPLAAFHPWLAVVPIAIAGTSAGLVAGLARFFASLPGAALPWADGPAGVASMVAVSGITVLVVWMALHPEGVVSRVMAVHHVLTVLLERAERVHARKGGCGEARPNVSGAARRRILMADLKTAKKRPEGIISGCCPKRPGQERPRQ
ncbi:ComEC/Rec2 family competence protein [Paenarthrobacter sp. NPDC056912]|uniref:ComEC/Rec2 family competence protein n=1 Tax=Paenarthrobacter sp. NPDC056912 TaxID=3345965 RepID=UPI00367200D1